MMPIPAGDQLTFAEMLQLIMIVLLSAVLATVAALIITVRRAGNSIEDMIEVLRGRIPRAYSDRVGGKWPDAQEIGSQESKRK